MARDLNPAYGEARPDGGRATAEGMDMPNARKIVGFDLGAESGRAVVGSLRDGRIELDVAHRFANAPVDIAGTLHWDVLGLFREMKAGLGLALDKHGGEISSIGCDTWGVDFGLLADDGSLVGNPVHYRDSRTDGMLDAAFARAPREEIYRTTGIQFMQINTAYQLLSMTLRSAPQLSIAKRMLMMAGLFHYFFTGEEVAEFSLATTSQMYDPVKGDWAREMLGRLGIPERILPPVVPSGTRVGTLRSAIASEVGAPGALPVIASGCHDTASAVAAVPARGDGWLYLSSGTWSLMGAETTEPILTDQALALNFTNEGGVGGRFRLLKNIMGLWLVQQCRRAWERKGDRLDYEELTRMAASAEPFQAFVNPDDPLFLNPPDMPEAIREFCRRTSQTPPATREAVLRCALESLALTYRATMERLNALLGRQHEVLHVVGGGGRNKLLNQFTAEACGVPVLAGPVEATVTGNILVQAMALGELSGLDELRQVVRNSFEVDSYEPSESGRWTDVFGRYLRVVGEETAGVERPGS